MKSGHGFPIWSRVCAVSVAASGCLAWVTPTLAAETTPRIFIHCWSEGPPRMRHLDFALDGTRISIGLAERERMLEIARKRCAAAAEHVGFQFEAPQTARRDAGLLLGDMP